MLINGSNLVNCPVLSLHIGGELARVTELIIDPNNLKVLAFRVDGKTINDDTGDILPVDSVREFSRMGMIIDSIDELVHDGDIVRIKQVLDLNFTLVGLKVTTRQKAKLGKVIDCIVSVSDWAVQQIIVQRPAIKALFDPELVISRQKIIEVTDYEVVIKDEHDKTKSKVENVAPAEFVPNFVNPFREPEYASEAKKDLPKP